MVINTLFMLVKDGIISVEDTAKKSIYKRKYV